MDAEDGGVVRVVGFGRVVSYYARPASARTGGVNRSRQEWMAALADEGLPVVLIDAAGGFTDVLVDRPGLRRQQLAHLGRGRMTLLPRGLRHRIRRGDLVYLHEGWTPSNLVAGWWCRRLDIPYVVMPHGVYERQIVATLRRFPFRRALERRLLEGAQAVHLFFESEIAELHDLAPGARPVVAMTGRAVPATRWTAHDPTHLIWIGRYDVHHKGLDILLEALASIPANSRPRLRLHGPDHLGGKAEVTRLTTELGLDAHVEVADELAPAEVDDRLLASSGFVHIARWEAFGRSIVEAVSLGVPVVLGDGAHIAGTLAETDAARVVPSTDPQQVAHALVELWSGDLDHLSDAGRRWAETELGWPAARTRLLAQLDASPGRGD